MKRVLKTTLAAIMAVAVLAGCSMKESIGFKIDGDKKVSMSVTIAYDKEFVDGLVSMNGTSSDQITDEMRWEAVKDDGDMEGFTAKKIEEEGKYGYVYTKELGTLDEISTEDKNAERVSLSDDEFTKSKAFFVKDGNTYKSNMKIDKTDESFQQMDQYKEYNIDFDVKLVVELPNKSTSNNASEVSEDGKTLSWNLLTAENIDFEFTFDSASKATTGSNTNKTSSVTDKSNMIVYIGIGGACVVAIIAVIIVMSSKKGKVETAPVQTITPAEPVAPTTPVEPVAPAAPVAPAEPVVPAAPAEPVVPAAPVAPAEPVAPAVPETPVAPETTQDTTINQ